MADIDSKLRAAEQIGAILKAKREEQNKSQRDVALELGYRNVNFISMIESGRSNPPLSRMSDICRVYDMEPEFLPMMVRLIYPETWEVVTTLLMQGKEIFANKTPASIERTLDKRMVRYLKDYHITT